MQGGFVVEIRLGVYKERDWNAKGIEAEKIIAAWNYGEEREGGVSGIVCVCECECVCEKAD